MSKRSSVTLAFVSLCVLSTQSLPAEIVFPGLPWAEKAPADAGMGAAALDPIAETLGGHGCVVKDAYIAKQSGDGTETVWQRTGDSTPYTITDGGGNGIIDRPSDVGGWPELRSAPAPADRDHDGMPDAWETEHGLNPDDSSDGPADSDGDGYTNLEAYLNELAP